ncbi:S-layer homology domain-containing protein [Paenibacillus sp. IITD108]|uniref:S-layer homology domain-containing protein n=1 Tax=Paenibacillus sp. IITD108 TaxID=3116649 RepID=UPI002F3EA2C9
MCQRRKKIWIVWLAICLGCVGVIPASNVNAAELLFEQGAGYESGAYERKAAQPTAFNWVRQSRFTGSTDSEEKWTFAAEGSIYSTPAIGTDGTLYVGSYDGKLYAIDSRTGRLKWSFVTEGAIASSPAIGADGTIYVGSGDGRLYALDPNAEHKQIWAFETGDSVHASPVIGGDGTIYIGSYDGNLYALDPYATVDNEREIWSYEIGGEIDSSPAIGHDGTIYVGSGIGMFYALDPHADDDQREKWSIELNMGYDGLCWDDLCPVYSSPAIGADGRTIYVGSDDGFVYALDPNASDDNNRVKWSFDAWGSVLSSPAIGDDGTVYIGSYDGALYALDPDADDEHRVKWSLNTATNPWIPIISSPVVGAGGIVYIGSGNKKLYALDPYASDDDRVKWSFATAGEIYSSPVIGPDGTIYIGSYDKRLYAIGTRSILVPDEVAAVADESAVKLAWSDVYGAAGYKLYQYEGTEAPESRNEWTLVNDDELIAETEYMAKNLKAGQIYWFAIKAVGTEEIESEFSDYVSAMPYTNVAKVDELARLQVAKGTKLDKLTLPEEVNAQLSDGSAIKLPVSWDLVNTDYNFAQAGTYKITGELQLSAHIRNPGILNAELTVIVLPGINGGWYLSNNANLKTLEIWTEDNLIPLTPSFMGDTLSYTAKTAADLIEVTAIADHPAAKVTWNEQVLADSIQVDLQEGANDISLIVQAEDGSRKTYKLYVERQMPEQEKHEPPVISFTDIAGHWSEAYIKRAIAKSFVSGYPDKTFLPDRPVTRAEFTVMLVKALNLGEGSANLSFTDYEQFGAWAKQAVAQAVQAGFVQGYADGSFRPNMPITRVEMAVIIARALKMQPNAYGTTGFADNEEIPKWAKGAVEDLRKLEIIRGYSNNKFVPGKPATRAEAIVMLLRMLDVLDQKI